MLAEQHPALIDAVRVCPFPADGPLQFLRRLFRQGSFGSSQGDLALLGTAWALSQRKNFRDACIEQNIVYSRFYRFSMHSTALSNSGPGTMNRLSHTLDIYQAI